jgi:LysM repeat protein
VAALNWHTVRKGETLLSISRKLKVNRADLADANYLSVKSRVTVGQELIIPRAPTLLLTTSTDNPAPLIENAEGGCRCHRQCNRAECAGER